MDNLKSGKPRAVLCIHDVSPGSLPSVERILADLEAVGIEAVNLAVVPAFHGAESWAEAGGGARAIAAVPGRFRAEFLLHGCYHRRVGENTRLRWSARFLSRLQSAGEDEFFRLDPREAAGRIEQGMSLLARDLGIRPRGFIPPAWALDQGLLGILADAGLSYTEDHFRVYDLESGRASPSPVIAFSSRTPLRRVLSRAWSRGVYRLASRPRVLRIAIHPADVQSPPIWRCALEMIAKAGQEYRFCLYGETFQGPDPPTRIIHESRRVL